jgi:hypothetical protein
MATNETGTFQKINISFFVYLITKTNYTLLLKRSIYIGLFTLLFLSCHKDTTENTEKAGCNFTNFFYYHGQKDTIGEMSNSYLLVAFDTSYSENAIQNFITSLSEFDQQYKYKLSREKLTILKFGKPKNCEEISNIIINLEKKPIIRYANFTMQSNDCSNAFSMPMGNLCVYYYSDYFDVKVKDVNDLTDLYKMMKETNTVLVEQNQFMNDWFTLSATKYSKGDGLHMANYFYESKLFIESEPNYGRVAVE